MSHAIQFESIITKQDIHTSQNNNQHKNLTAAEFSKQLCEPILADAYTTFCFDKFIYVLCKHNKQPSHHGMLAHKSGNCYAFALYVQMLLLQRGIDSRIVCGSPPAYFMRPMFRGVCHAAVFVPLKRPDVWGILVDPSIYGLPIIVAAPHATQPIRSKSGHDYTRMRDYCNYLIASIQQPKQPNDSLRIRNVSNPDDPSTTVVLPPGVCVIRVRNDKDDGEFSYALSAVRNFDDTITRRVHGINRDIFRTSTDKKGRWLSTIRYSPEHNTVYFINHVTNKRRTLNTQDNLTVQSVHEVLHDMGDKYIQQLRYDRPHGSKNIYAMLRRVIVS